MVDLNFQPKVYKTAGGDELVVASGGLINMEPGSNIILPNPTGAADYFVDLNVETTGSTGLNWGDAFQTIAEAITASNISIGLSANRWWARRNRIFVQGDGITEDLTVLPEKTDIIGLGTDLFPFPRIIGNHTIAVAKVGVRIINMGFFTSGTGDLWVFPSGCHGLQILGCMMHPGTTSTKAIELGASAHVRINGNKIMIGGGDRSNIFGLGISVEGTVIHDVEITNNYIDATLGIDIVEAAANAEGGLIADNTIRATGLTIEDSSGDFEVINNRLISAANDDGTGTGGSALAVKCDVNLSAGNRLTSGDHLNAPFPIEGTLS